MFDRKEYWKKYYDQHRVEICSKTIDDYFERAIVRDKKRAGDKIDKLFKEYPIGMYKNYAMAICHRKGVYKSNSYLWEECLAFADRAHWYSVSRCAVEGYSYVENYIKKMIRIYIMCRVIVYHYENNHVSWDEIQERKHNRMRWSA